VQNAKRIGLATAVAVVLTMCVGAAAASASQFRAEEYPVKTGGTQTAEWHFGTATSVLARCESGTFSGAVSTASSQLTTVPSLSGCSAGSWINEGVMHSCSYAFNSTNSEAPFTGNLDLVCSKEGDGIEFLTLSGCRIKIPAQTNMAQVQYGNVGTGNSRTITASISGTAVKYSKTLTYEGSVCSKGTGSFENGILTESLSLSASKLQTQVGLYLANAQVEDPPYVKGETYPLVLTGSSKATISTNLGVVSCESISLLTQQEGPGRNLDFFPEAKNCPYGFGTMVLEPHGCSLVAHVSSGAGPYSGLLGVGCAEPSQALTFVGGGCTLEFPPQIGEVATFENAGSGSGRTIQMTSSGSGGLRYISSCNGGAEYTNGVISGSWKLTGYSLTGGFVGPAEGVWIE
jgi:hypothetical protein